MEQFWEARISWNNHCRDDICKRVACKQQVAGSCMLKFFEEYDSVCGKILKFS